MVFPRVSLKPNLNSSQRKHQNYGNNAKSFARVIESIYMFKNFWQQETK